MVVGWGREGVGVVVGEGWLEFQDLLVNWIDISRKWRILSELMAALLL